MSQPPIHTLVLGGTGYVAGELLRLLAGHPSLELRAAVSESQGGKAIAEVFPHLAGSFPGAVFAAREELPALVGEAPNLAVFSAAPHGASAAVIDEVLSLADAAGTVVNVVDLSADFRYRDAETYASIYGHPHAAPQRLAKFFCSVPEHGPARPETHCTQPGCFTTATVLAVVPLLAGGWIEPRVMVSAVTGSTGAGRTPTATTHHPERRSTLFAYNPFAHRHQPEMRALAAAASGVEPELFFVPQSGPFARGIYATISAPLARAAEAEEIRAAVAEYYRAAPFVDVLSAPPKLQEVVGTNRCRLHFAARDGHLVAFSAIDNLVKGAAGGALQWMNRQLGLPETSGLMQPGLGWI